MALEFALVMLFLVPLLAGGYNCARAYSVFLRVRDAAREATRYAFTDPNSVAPTGGNCADPNNITYRANQENAQIKLGETVQVAKVISPGNTVPITGCGGNTVSSGDTVAVTVSRPFQTNFPFGLNLNLTISSTDQVVVG